MTGVSGYRRMPTQEGARPRCCCRNALYNKNNKTQLIYLEKKRQDRARQYSANYKRLREIVEEMTQLNMALLKENYDI